MTSITPPATRASAPPVKRNGNGDQPAQTLPEHRQKTVEAGLATYQQVLAERDDLEAKLRSSMMQIEQMQVQLKSLTGISSLMEDKYRASLLELESRVSTYQAQRDEAVVRTASLEAVLANIYSILRHTIAEPDHVEQGHS